MGAILAPEGCQQKSLLKVDVNMFLDKIGPQGVPSLALEFCSKRRPNFWATWTLKTAYYGVLTYIWRQTRESKSSSALVPWDSGHSQVPFFPRYRIQQLNTSERGSDEKNLLVLQPLLTSNPTPLTTEHGYFGMEPDYGVRRLDTSKIQKTPEGSGMLLVCLNTMKKITTRVRHAKTMVFH